MGGLFGIGTYQPITGGTTTGSGFPTQAFQLLPPTSGVYGGQYGYVLNTRIRAPKMSMYTPTPLVGLDSIGTPVVRGYPQITWAYSELRPDYWYYLLNVYNQSARTPPGFQYLTLLQYPDQSGNNVPVQVLARMNPPTHGYRTVGAYMNVTLNFFYVGQTQLLPGTSVTVLS